MALFKRYSADGITGVTTVHASDATAGTNADIIIGCNIANTHSATVTVDVLVGAIYLAKSVSIPVGGSVEIIQGKVVLENGDILKVTPSASVDVWVSVLDGATA